MSDVAFRMLELVVSVAIIFGGTFVIYLKNKSTKFANLVEWVNNAVRAAEKMFPESGSGEKKKKYVVEFITNVSKKIGITITEDQINILIESAVKDLDLLEGKN